MQFFPILVAMTLQNIITLVNKLNYSHICRQFFRSIVDSLNNGGEISQEQMDYLLSSGMYTPEELNNAFKGTASGGYIIDPDSTYTAESFTSDLFPCRSN